MKLVLNYLFHFLDTITYTSRGFSHVISFLKLNIHCFYLLLRLKLYDFVVQLH